MKNPTAKTLTGIERLVVLDSAKFQTKENWPMEKSLKLSESESHNE